MSLEFLGIGDLHLDGKLTKYLPDLNSRIIQEVEKVVTHARRNGVRLLVFYGDICETPNMSKEAGVLLLRFIMDNPDLKMLFLLGNHDMENAELHSMQLFAEFCGRGLLPHVRVIEKPTTLFKKSGTPLRLLPWPSLDTSADCLNVIHEAVAGSVWDHGRPVDSAHKVKHWSVAGHIHTAQKVGKAHFSGTLYQTSFGEKPNKYFHHVQWEDPEEPPQIKKIKHAPGFKLVNLVVSEKSDLDDLSEDRNTLYKVFVKDAVALDATTFDKYPNVVKVNSFKTKTELQTLISEELRLDEEFQLPSMLSVENNLKEWLGRAEVEPALKRTAYRKFKELFAS